MTQTRLIALVVTTVFAISGCSLITDFDEPGGLYSLEQNMGAVTVTLFSANSTGTLSLGFTETLPPGDDFALLALLDNSITVNVANDTGVNYFLTEGTRVIDTPSNSGEYALTMNEDRSAIAISFYNRHANTSIHSGGNYTATITVISDNDFFVVESLTRSVTVVDG